MRFNRDKWQFIDSNIRSKTKLSPTEVRYWKDLLTKLLKIGIEFELNLKDNEEKPNKLLCNGTLVFLRPCAKVKNDCWQVCAKIDECLNTKSYYTCANANTDNCPNKTKAFIDQNICNDCESYVFECLGEGCNEFLPACVTCNKFKKPCKNCNLFFKNNVKTIQLNPKLARETITVELQPTGTYKKVGDGILSVTRDGSLLGEGGVEIITVGRRVNYWEFYNMSKKVLDTASKYGAYVNERCGAHMHVLTSYYNNVNELERPIPEIILANFHQLVRKYQNALTWLTMALNEPNHLTRWEKFRHSVLDVSAVKRNIVEVSALLSTLSNSPKYSFVNYNNCVFVQSSSDVRVLHIEFREADATMCPSYYAALACLHYAFVIKAVEMSRYGVLLLGTHEDVENAKEMKKRILNGARKGYDSDRKSNTEQVLDNADYFRNEAKDMLTQLKNILIRFYPAYDILEDLAKTPVALRRLDGKTWDDIENELYRKELHQDLLHLKLDEIIDLKLVDDCTDINEWVNAVKQFIDEDDDNITKCSVEKIVNYIEGRQREGDIVWMKKLGCFISV